MTSKKTPQPTDVEVGALASDAYGNPGGVVAGELIESAWGNQVAARVVRTFPDVAALNAAPGAVRGQMATVTGPTDRVYYRGASTWAMVSWGGLVVSPTTNASGQTNIPHGLGSMPGWVSITPVKDGNPSSEFARCLVIGMTTTYVTVEVHDIRNNNLIGSNAIGVYLVVGGV